MYAAHSWKLNSNVEHKKWNFISICHVHCFVHYITINITTFLTVFGRFPTTFRKFSSILLLIPQPHARFRRHLSKMSEDYRSCKRLLKIWRCFDHTPTTDLNTVKGPSMSLYQALRLYISLQEKTKDYVSNYGFSRGWKSLWTTGVYIMKIFLSVWRLKAFKEEFLVQGKNTAVVLNSAASK